MINTAREILQKYWKYPDFRPDQEKVIDSILQKQDTLALLPTGGGKSICYQVPGMVLDGVTIVISPLIALMNDQVSHLKDRGISAIAITSGMSFKEVDIALENAVYHKYKFVYVSPERVNTDLFQQRLVSMTVALFAIDEAHCISQWGFDFRPSYLKLNKLRELLPNTPILALTASAPPQVITDISKHLHLSEHHIITGNFSRPNLSYYFMRNDNKPIQIQKILNKTQGAGIVYTYTRKEAKKLAEWLQSQNIKAGYYHGGLSYENREKSRIQWMKNKKPFMCATNAFGMGIDKSDVRVVVHHNLPLSIEAYYQEAGRAGRDGQKAWSMVLFNDTDIAELTTRLDRSFPELKTIKHIYKVLTNFYLLPPGTGGGSSFPFDITQICQRYNLKPNAIFNSIKFLEKEGYITLSDSARTPSRIMINASQKALYNYRLKDRMVGESIEILLRSYTGLFDDFQTINETLLAQRIQQNRKTVVQHFRLLHKMNLLIYREQTETPWLTFTEDAVMEKNLRISPENYYYLKQIAHKRLDAFVQLLLTKNQCRNTIILDYFGIENTEDCGICDICIKRSKESNFSINESDIEKIQRLKLQNLTDQKIIESFPLIEKSNIIRLLKYINDEEKD
jgi:ATP-dependent DNA helicase RecQ